MRKNLIRIGLLLLIIAIGGIAVYKYAMKPVADTADLKAEVKQNFQELDKLMSANDTAGLNKLTNKVVEIEAGITAVQNQDSLVSITLGDSTSSNTIECQVDSRHLAAFKSLNKGQSIRIKGICSGFSADELGIGSSLQMKNCVLANGQ